MVSEELVTWVKNAKSKGYSDDQIKQYLVAKGYSQENINELLFLVSEDEVDVTASSSQKSSSQSTASSQPVKSTSSSPLPKKKLNIKAVVMIVLFVAAGVFLFVSFSGSGVACESDVVCDDGDASTYDMCRNPGLETASCISAKEVAVEMQTSTTYTLSPKESVAVNVNGEYVMVTLEKVGATLAQVRTSQPRKVLLLRQGASQSLDIENDGSDDYIITMNSFSSTADIGIQLSRVIGNN